LWQRRKFSVKKLLLRRVVESTDKISLKMEPFAMHGFSRDLPEKALTATSARRDTARAA
jgi:hypothetical protein